MKLHSDILEGKKKTSAQPPAGQLLDVSKLSGGLLLKGLLPFYVMLLLGREDMYGKEILESISKMSGGKWRPSPGSIYPLLQKIVNLGYATEHLDDSQGRLRRVYKLTAAGREALPEMRQSVRERLQRTIELLNLHLYELDKDTWWGNENS